MLAQNLILKNPEFIFLRLCLPCIQIFSVLAYFTLIVCAFLFSVAAD